MKVIKDNVFIFLSLLVILTYGIIEYFYHGRFAIFGNIVGWLVALLIAINYLQKNRRDNQTTKKEEFKKSLEIVAFREINKEIYNFSHLIGNISVYYIDIKNKLFMHEKYPEIQKFNKVEIDFQIGQQVVNILKGVSDLSLVIESNEIAVIQVDHLKKYIQFKTEDVKELIIDFQKYFFKETIKDLLTKKGNSEFTKKCDEIIDNLFTIQCYLFDYRIELMNSLFGDIFDIKVPLRRPKDSKYKLLTEIATKEEVEKELKKREDRYSS
ncbi:MAG: hypothetical protein MUP69_09215 [Candidatus Atribacteria bacterium]|nr:hypothetical protein [Candidatus Atribacteria bacterium]